MRIGIITMLKVGNYGTELQAYALQRKLNLLGFNCENIDYLFYKHPDYKWCKAAAPLVPLGWKNRLKEFLYPKLRRLSTFPHRHEQERRNRSFEDFHQRHTRMSAKTYRSMDELYAETFDYDAFVVGSDQVWNPRVNTSLKPYFLTFAPTGKKKLSYASSFGVDRIPRVLANEYAQYLNDLNAISAREQSGVDIVKNITGRDVSHVLDPTLLLDEAEWEPVAVVPNMVEPYVLLYDLMPSQAALTIARELARQIGKARIVRLCRDCGAKAVAGVANAVEAGPSEFLGLFQKASAVVTNSFHGTAFSINFRKPFYSVIPDRMTNAGRIYGICEKVGLLERIVVEGSEASQRLDCEVDFLNSAKRLVQARTESLDYLLGALRD